MNNLAKRKSGFATVIKHFLVVGALLVTVLAGVSTDGYCQTQSSVGYVDGSGNPHFSVSTGTLKTAFVDELNYDAATINHGSACDSVAIIQYLGSWYLVGYCSNPNFTSMGCNIGLSLDGSGNLYITALNVAQCESKDNCSNCKGQPPCPACTGNTHCAQNTLNLYNGANHLGNFY